MKIGRRGFLSFVIGGAAGTALSPLPWKLMDDSSIWTQMWPWTPVPEDGEAARQRREEAERRLSGGDDPADR